MVYYMPLTFQNCSRKTKKTNMQLFNDYRSGCLKEPHWKNDCGSFLPCFLLVIQGGEELPLWMETSNNGGHVVCSRKLVRAYK
jgi:hypothetical protein